MISGLAVSSGEQAAIERAMERALALARSALGRTSPSPAVGAVVLRDGRVVGEGVTRPPGGDHAEVVALRQAGEAARGGTLVVTLEPCNHAGRTPPCTEAIVRAGIRQVVAAVRDPNPRVAGGGLAWLRAAGLVVNLGSHARAAAELNYGFFKLVATARPFVTAKWAMTLDGRIAPPGGGGAVTGAAAHARAHQERDAADAVMIGIGTARRDDPRLTVRPAPADRRQPQRVVVDSQAFLPTTARMLAEPGPTLVCCSAGAPLDHVRRLEAAGAEVVALSADTAGRVALPAVLAELGTRGLANVLVEGGATLLGACFAADAVDRVMAFVAPSLFGDGVPALLLPGGLAAPLMLPDAQVGRAGDDFLISGYLRRYDPPEVT